MFPVCLLHGFPLQLWSTASFPAVSPSSGFLPQRPVSQASADGVNVVLCLYTFVRNQQYSRRFSMKSTVPVQHQELATPSWADDGAIPDFAAGTVNSPSF